LQRKRSFEPSDNRIVPDPDHDPARPAKGGDCAGALVETKASMSETAAILRIEYIVIGFFLVVLSNYRDNDVWHRDAELRLSDGGDFDRITRPLWNDRKLDL
jgi:hypothetical protein